MSELLVVYAYVDHPLRATIEEHLYSFARHAPHRCTYVNLAVRRLPRDLDRYDLVVFHTSFLSARWIPSVFKRFRARAERLKHARGVKIALPQDEFINTGVLCDFINDMRIDQVFSVAPPSEWPKIYDGVDRTRVAFHQVLTGYLDRATLARIQAMGTPARPIDIGYRAWRAEAWLGRRGLLKTRLSDEAAARGPAHGLKVDASTRAEDTLLGDAWFEFLLRCRYTIGVEGGAAILDRDGAIMRRTQAYTAAHPGAGFDQVEANCFPGLDGSLALFALSPRHLEACVTRTCQVLVEGDYNGILEPHKHYIPLREDLSDLDEVLAGLGDEERRLAMVERAYQDVVASGRYSYQGFVDFVLERALHNAPPTPAKGAVLWRWMLFADKMSWARVAVTAAVKRLGRKLLPTQWVARLRDVKNR